MSNNKATIYEMSISKGMGHATVITRVRIYDNGRILINLMNPSGAGGNSIKKFQNPLILIRVTKF